MDEQGATGSVGALQSGEYIAPAGRTGFNIFRPVAHLRKLFGNPLGALGLALRGLGFTGVGGIKSNQSADNLDHVVAGVAGDSGLSCHSHQSYHCQTGGARRQLGWALAG